MRTWKILVAAVAILLAAGMGRAAITLGTVHVGNPGNAADPRYPATNGGPSSFGAVAYTYNIGTYEVTAGQYTAFLNAVATTDTYGLYNTKMADPTSGVYATGTIGCNIQRSGSSGGYTYSVAPDWADRPVNYVSWGDAARFVNWLHNGQPNGLQNASTTEDGAYLLNGANTDGALGPIARKANAKWVLPSENEWYKAAYYKGGSTNAGYWNYPTRTDTAPGRDKADASGNNANFYAGGAPIDPGRYTMVAGEFQNSLSPYGTYDQGGNVMEWTENNCLYIGSSQHRARGGSFYQTVNSLQAASATSFNPTWESNSLGFRVSQLPEPASIVLLALGGLAMLRRRQQA